MSTLFYVVPSSSSVPLAFVDAACQAEADTYVAGRKAQEPARFVDCKAVPYEDWLAERQRGYLAEPAASIDEAAFDYALNCLPPRYCQIAGADLAFFVTEAVDDGVYRQYARFGDRHLSKCALPQDPSTHLSVADVATAVPR